MIRVNPTRILSAASAYFAAVFAVGFALGTLRVLVLVPMLGTRWAELVELPLMVAASVWLARRICRRLQVPSAAAPRFAVGALALLALLAVEFGLVLRLRGLGLDEYLAQRDPVSGTAYALSLLAFALAPWWVGRRDRSG